MRTIRAILLGGPADGRSCHPLADCQAIHIRSVCYLRTGAKDAEHRQIFAEIHPRTLRRIRWGR